MQTAAEEGQDSKEIDSGTDAVGVGGTMEMEVEVEVEGGDR